jgi:hypothetical protein
MAVGREIVVVKSGRFALPMVGAVVVGSMILAGPAMATDPTPPPSAPPAVRPDSRSQGESVEAQALLAGDRELVLPYGYVKRNTKTGRFMDQKVDGKPFKGVTKE